MYQLLSYTQLNEKTKLKYYLKLSDKDLDLTYYYKLDIPEDDMKIIFLNGNIPNNSESEDIDDLDDLGEIDIDDDEIYIGDDDNESKDNRIESNKKYIIEEADKYIQKDNMKRLEIFKKYDPIKINIKSGNLEKNNIAMPDEIYYELLRKLGPQNIIHCSEYYDINDYRYKYIFTDHHNIYNIKVYFNNREKNIRINIDGVIDQGFIKMDNIYNDYIISIVKQKLDISNNTAIAEVYYDYNRDPLTPEYIYSSYMDIISATIKNCVDSESKLDDMDNQIIKLKQRVKELREII
jgi:hypothetical protein